MPTRMFAIKIFVYSRHALLTFEKDNSLVRAYMSQYLEKNPTNIKEYTYMYTWTNNSNLLEYNLSTI